MYDTRYKRNNLDVLRKKNQNYENNEGQRITIASKSKEQIQKAGVDTGESNIRHNFYDDPKFSLEKTASNYLDRVNGFYVSDSFFQKAQDYNAFRDIADNGMLAVASDNALKMNKKGKKSLFESQTNSIFGNI